MANRLPETHSRTQPDLVLLSPGDPATLTGGHRYNRRLIESLAESGEHAELRSLTGQFPQMDSEAVRSLNEVLTAIPDGTPVIIDGLAFSAAPDIVSRHHLRLPLIALIHLPLADEAGLDPITREQLRQTERRALAFAAGVITTSPFCARRMSAYGVANDCVISVEPGQDPVPQGEREASQSSEVTVKLLCVANLMPRKGQDVLLSALAQLTNLPWQCTLVGSDQHTPIFAERLWEQAEALGLSDRLNWPGALQPDALTHEYQRADLFVLASHFETYGMVINEALSWGLPIVSTDGGALVDTVPSGAGLKVPVADPEALASALRKLIESPSLRQQMGQHALQAATTLPDWPDTARRFMQAVNRLTGKSGTAAPQIASPAIATPGQERDQFSADWLSSREQADHAARDTGLTRTLVDSLAKHDSIRVFDLGCGTGSNLRYLAPRLPQHQHWTLFDHDSMLLKVAEDLCANVMSGEEHPVTLDTQVADLEALKSVSWPEPPHLITASALLDLVSADWLEQMAHLASGWQAEVLITLTYNGDFGFSHPHPDDQLVRAAFNSHQRSGGLGPDAATVASEALQRHGFRVMQAISTWKLIDPNHNALKHGIIRGWADAAIEQAPEHRDHITQWRHERLARAHKDQITVGHVDLLAQPTSRLTTSSGHS